MVKRGLVGCQDMPQRRLEEWSIIDEEGRYLAPWHAAYGSVLATLQVPSRPPPHTTTQVQVERHASLSPLKIRLRAPDEWHAQCLDATGCHLPRYWLRGAAPAFAAVGPRGGGDKVWYLLGEPQDRYAIFLRTESSWLMSAYRIASFLSFSPKSTFSEVSRTPL